MTKTVNCMHNTTLLTADVIMKAFKDIWKGLIKHTNREAHIMVQIRYIIFAPLCSLPI